MKKILSRTKTRNRLHVGYQLPGPGHRAKRSERPTTCRVIEIQVPGNW
jgi:hypothetical protein